MDAGAPGPDHDRDHARRGTVAGTRCGTGALGGRADHDGAGAVAALVVAARIQPLRRSFDSERDPHTALGSIDLAGPLRAALGDPALRSLTLAAFAYAGCQVAVGAFFVVFLIDRVGVSLVAGGALFAFVQAGGFTGRILWGAIAGPGIRARPLLAALGAAIGAFLAAGGPRGPGAAGGSAQRR